MRRQMRPESEGGAELRRWREEHGLSQAELAREVGVESMTIYRWEMSLENPNSRRPNKFTRPLLDRAIGRLDRRQPAAV